MLNIHARAAVSRALTPLGARLARAGVTPDAITVVGTVGAVASAVIFFPRGWFFAGTLLIWAFVMFDMVDGAVARAGGGGSVFGAVLDSSCDRIADAAVFGSVAWYYARHGEKWMLLAALLCLILGSLTSYIRARAEATGLTGLPGHHVPYVLAVALWLLVAASTITVAQRFVTVWSQSKALQAAQSAEA